MQFQAVLGGKVVSYPANTTFTIEQRIGRKPFTLLRTKPDIHSALTAFHRAERTGKKVRLSCTENGRIKPLLSS